MRSQVSVRYLDTDSTCKLSPVLNVYLGERDISDQSKEMKVGFNLKTKV